MQVNPETKFDLMGKYSKWFKMLQFQETSYTLEWSRASVYLNKDKALVGFLITRRLAAVITNITYFTLISLFLVSFSYDYVFYSSCEFFSASSAFSPHILSLFYLEVFISFTLCGSIIFQSHSTFASLVEHVGLSVSTKDLS